jgi:hypothetical protein
LPARFARVEQGLPRIASGGRLLDGTARALSLGMRNTMILTTLTLTACAAHPAQPTMHLAYMCDAVELAHEGTHLDVHAQGATAAPSGVQLGWVDADGQHYVQWPLVATQRTSIEYVIPKDRYADAVALTYDTTAGQSKADWTLVGEATCKAKGGYTDALTRFAAGASMDDIQAAFQLTDKSEARELVHDAMIKLQRRYYGDR